MQNDRQNDNGRQNGNGSQNGNARQNGNAPFPPRPGSGAAGKAGDGISALTQFVPPNDVASEQSVLGACLIEKRAIDAIVGILTPEHFYRAGHVVIMRTLLGLYAEGHPVDLVTMRDALGPDGLAGVGGLGYLAALFDTVPTAANVAYYAAIVLDHATRRSAITAALTLIGAARDPNVPAMQSLGQAGTAMQDLQMGQSGGQREGLGRLMAAAYERAEERSQRPGGSGLLGLTTGLRDVDRITSGLQSPDFIVIAARPSQGKTAFVTRLMVSASQHHKVPCLLFSLEMSKEQMAVRILCMQAGVDSHRVRSGNMDEAEWHALAAASSNLYSDAIDVDDTTNLTPMQAGAIIRQFSQERGGLGLVAFDYIQLMSADERCENRTQQVTSIVRGLKNLAREFHVPVIGLSQLSRAVETRAGRRPQLSDLRDSGGVESEADVVCFLYNGDLYARQESPGPPITPGHRDMVELIIAKHRNGPVGTVRVGFQPVYTRFVNMAQLGDADAPDDAPYDAPYDPQANAPYDPQANAPYAPPGDAPLPPTRGSAASLAQAAISAGRYTRPTHGSAGHTGQRHAAGGQGAGKASDKRGKNAAGDYAPLPNYDSSPNYDLPSGEDD